MVFALWRIRLRQSCCAVDLESVCVARGGRSSARCGRGRSFPPIHLDAAGGRALGGLDIAADEIPYGSACTGSEMLLLAVRPLVGQ